MTGRDMHVYLLWMFNGIVILLPSGFILQNLMDKNNYNSSGTKHLEGQIRTGDGFTNSKVYPSKKKSKV
jgi:hypothetical protein